MGRAHMRPDPVRTGRCSFEADLDAHRSGYNAEAIFLGNNHKIIGFDARLVLFLFETDLDVYRLGKVLEVFLFGDDPKTMGFDCRLSTRNK